ncbi:MAG TPA: hypothetical protein VH372_20615 [Actinospica sp.]|nr:hypothetical protein [Actinospica sp.]
MSGSHKQAGPGAARRRIVVAAAVLACLGLAVWLTVADRQVTSAGAAGHAVASNSGRPAPTVSFPTEPTATASAAASASAPARSAAATGPCASPAACGFPSAADTGPRTRALTAHSGNQEIRTNGEVVSGWNLVGSLDVYANDVTVVDSRIDSSSWWAVNLRSGYTGLRILHSVLTGTPGAGPDNGGEDYAVTNMGAGSVEVGWDDVSVFGDALSLGNGSIHDDYVHDLHPFINRSGTYQHLNTIISDGDDRLGLRIEHNTLLNPVPADQGPTSAIGLLPNTGPISDTAVVDNWIAGGAYAIYGGGTGATGVVVTGNVFSTQYWSRCGVYGPVAYWNSGGAGNEWSDNRYSNGKTVFPAAAG